MAITSAGLGSGLDVEGIISKLMSIERQPLARLAKKEASFQAKLSAYGSLNGAVSSFKSAASAINSTAGLNAVAASSSDTSVVTASGVSTAASGSYTVEVSQLAKAQQVVAAGQNSLSTSLGSGTLTFDFGTISGGVFNAGTGQYAGSTFTSNGNGIKTVAITAANDSLIGIRDAVNAAGIGVTATIINDGSAAPYRLSFTSNSQGAANSIKLTVPDNLGGSLDTFISNDPAGTQHLAETSTAQSSIFKINGLQITQNSNTVTSVINGVTLNLLKTNVGTPATVGISKNSSAFVSNVNDFVKKYNELNATVKDLTKYDPKTKEAGLLIGDSAARGVQSQLRNIMAASVPGISGSYTNLGQIGITFQKDGSLALDSSKLSTALSTNATDVASLFASIGKPTDALVGYVSSTSSTAVGARQLNVTALATQGNIVGSVVAGTVITAGVNDSLGVTIDGIITTVTVPAGTYTAAGLDSAIQSAINGDSNISAAGSSVAVTDAGGVLTLTSNKYGSASSVVITGGNASAALFGVPITTNATGVDVAGSIDGSIGTGSGQTLSGTDGLVVTVSGGALGSRGTVNFARGYGFLLDAAAASFLGTSGTIAGKQDSINKSIDSINQQRARFATQFTATEKRYRAQFSALDGAISNLTATGNFLTQQLNALTKSTR
ncbi:MAG: flagellar filament capping protein FliD [Methylophilaceae bacterium]